MLYEHLLNSMHVLYTCMYQELHTMYDENEQFQTTTIFNKMHLSVYAHINLVSEKSK